MSLKCMSKNHTTTQIVNLTLLSQSLTPPTHLQQPLSFQCFAFVFENTLNLICFTILVDYHLTFPLMERHSSKLFCEQLLFIVLSYSYIPEITTFEIVESKRQAKKQKKDKEECIHVRSYCIWPVNFYSQTEITFFFKSKEVTSVCLF